jgi:hypothetical protein
MCTTWPGTVSPPPHPPYSLDPAASVSPLFTHSKQFLGGTCKGSDEEVKKTVKDWFNRLAADLYNVGIQKLITQHKCLNLLGDYVGKLFNACCNDVKSIFFILITKRSLFSE